MASKINQYTIHIEDLLYKIAPDGTKTLLPECKDATIEWDKDNLCAAISCYLDGGKTIHVSIPEDCDECFYVNYTCHDSDCDSCNTTSRLKICPCETATDCGPCEDCVGHICVSLCDEGEFCAEGEICKECDDAHPCSNGKVCNGGKCDCPPSKPYMNHKGDCVPCLDGTCPQGQKCTPDGCKPIDCEEGVWDPDKNKCVACKKSGDCKGPNEICINDECVCAPGFHRDPVTGLCVENPNCETDADCGPCKKCDKDGNCVPIECPAGKICVPGEGCVEICDCNNPKCSNGYGCSPVPGNPSKCFCDKNARPNPCGNKTCTDGRDCGENCGCNKVTKKCESCDGENANDLLGCNPAACDGQPCNSGKCDIGCTCINEECVSCDKFECPISCATHPGCGCEGGDCGGVPYACNDRIEGTKGDCQLKLNVSIVDGCSCPVINAFGGITSIEKSGVDRKYNFRIQLSKGLASTYDEAKARPLLGNNSHPDIADNDLPMGGVIDLVVKHTIQAYYWNSGWKTNGQPSFIEERVNMSYGNKDTVDYVYDGKKLGEIIEYGPNVGYSVVNYQFYFEQKSALKFENGCNYMSNIVIGNIYLTANDNYKIENNIVADWRVFRKLTTDDKRTPLLTWYRSATNQYSPANIIRKVYLAKNGTGSYTDTLWGPKKPNSSSQQTLVYPEGGLLGNRYYKATIDCGCGTREYDFGHVAFCSPKTGLTAPTMSNCNRTIKLNGQFNPCAVNMFLGKSEWNVGAGERATAQARWFLIINGQKVETFQANTSDVVVSDSGNGVPIINYSYTMPNQNDKITSAVLQMTYDGKVIECETVFTIPDVPNTIINATPVCNVAAGSYTITLGKSAYAIDDIVASNVQKSTTGTGSSTAYVFTQEIGKKINVTIKFANGCTKEFTFADNCCSLIQGITLIRTGDECTLTGTSLSAKFVGGGTIPGNVTFKKDGQVVDSTNNTVDVGTLGAGTYTASYYHEGCGKTYEATLTINPASGVEVEYGWEDVSSPNSPNRDWVFKVTNKGTTTVNFKYRVAVQAVEGGSFSVYGSLQSINIPINGSIRLNDNSSNQLFELHVRTISYKAPGTYPGARIEDISYYSLTAAACVTTDDTVYEKTVESGGSLVSSYKINGVTTTQTICTGSEVLHEFEGAPGAQLTIKKGSTFAFNVTLNPAGVGSYSEIASSTGQYSIVSAQLNDYVEEYTTEWKRIVNVANGGTITLISNDCDNAMANRIVSFNLPPGAASLATAKLNGVNVPFVGNTVTLAGTDVGQLDVTANNGSCTTALSVSIAACSCENSTLSGNLGVSSNVICDGDAVILNTTGIVGGADPYTVQYYLNNTLPSSAISSEISLNPGVTSHTYSSYHANVANGSNQDYLVVIRDAAGCSKTYSVSVSVSAPQVIDITPQGSGAGITYNGHSHYTVCDSVGSFNFIITGAGTISWSISGAYGGVGIPISGASNTIPITVSAISGLATIDVTVVSNSGCTSNKSITMTKQSCKIIEDDDFLVITSAGRLLKLTMNASGTGLISGTPTVMCPSTANGGDIAISNNILYSFKGGTDLWVPVQTIPLTGSTPCVPDSIPSSGVAWSGVNPTISNPDLGELAPGVLVYSLLLSGSAGVRLYKYTVATNTHEVLIDLAIAGLQTLGDGVRMGSKYYLGGLILGGSQHLYSFDISGAILSNPVDMGVVTYNGYGLVNINNKLFSIGSNGAMYRIDISGGLVSAVVPAGTITLDGAELVYGSTNNPI